MKTFFYYILLFCFVGMLSPAFSQITVFPSYYEDFENGDGGWSPSGTNSSWEFGTPDGKNISGAYSGSNAWATSLTDFYNTDELSYLTSPQFDFSCMSEDPILQFSHAFWFEDEWDFYWVEISVNGGAWTKLGSAGSGGNWYNTWYNQNTDTETDVFCGEDVYSKGWDRASHVLTGAAGSSDVRIRFVVDSDGSYEVDGVYLDDIQIDVVNTTLSSVVLDSPINTTTGHPLDISLSWNNHSCADFYEIEVSTTDDFSNIISSGSKLDVVSYDITGLDYETQYFWRVRAYKDGNPGNWSDTYNFTTIIAPPFAPVQVLPTDGSVNVSPAVLALQWQSQIKASSYRVQVASDIDFVNIITDESTSGGTIILTGVLGYGNNYYWRVSASNVSGTSDWSQTWTLSTLLPTPSLTMPANSEQGLTLPVQFTWQAIQGISTYSLQIATDADFSTIVFDNTVNGTSYTANTLDADTRYYWRVKAIGSGGIMSEYTTHRNLSTVVPSPKLSLPYSGSLDMETSVDLVWIANPKPAKYQVQVSAKSDFSTIVADKTVDVVTTPITGLTNNQTYYWRVRAITTDKGNSSWSESYTFVTIVASTTNLLPANNTKKVVYPVMLEWKSAGQNIMYDVEIAADKNFTTIVAKEVVSDGNKREFSTYEGLEYYRTYWWRVRPHTQTNKTVEWSPSFSFTSSIDKAQAISPENNSMDQSTTTRFRWSAVRGVETYTIVVSKTPNFSDTVVKMNNLTSPNFMPSTELELSTTYYWNIVSISAEDGITVSKTWTFKTADAKIAAAPQLLAPENAVILPTGTVELKWETITNATAYDVQVSADINFGTLLYDGKGQTASSWTIDANTPEQTLYWRVRSVNNAGVSSWSSARRFTTAAEALAAPALVSPPQSAVKVEPMVILSWATAPKANSYYIQVSSDENFTQLVYEKGKIIGQSTLPIQLSYTTKYFWRVASENEAGMSAWSTVWDFTTSEPVSSVHEQDLSNTVSVSPQPANDMLTVQLGMEWANGATIRLFSMSGEMVLSIANTPASVITIPTETLNTGAYMLQIQNDKVSTTVPVMINK